MTPDEQGRLIEEVDHDIERLHALYNQYFMGIEKLEPTVQYKNLERKVQLLRKEQIHNTALRFRFQMLVQKLNTQTQYWRRVCRQIEEGTYQRHVVRAQQRTLRASVAPAPPPRDALPEPQTAPQDWSFDEPGLNQPAASLPATVVSNPQASTPLFPIADLDDPFDDLTDPELRQQQAHANSAKKRSGRHNLLDLDDPLDVPPAPPRPTPPTHAAPAVPKPTAAKPTSLDEERTMQVFKTYLLARKKTNENVEGLTYEKVRASLEKQFVAKQGKVDFKVVIRDGRAVIKSVNKD